MSKLKEYAGVTKNRLMLYTFVALLALAIITIISWWDLKAIDVMTSMETGWPYGLGLIANVLIAVGIAVGIDTPAAFHGDTADIEEDRSAVRLIADWIECAT